MRKSERKVFVNLTRYDGPGIYEIRNLENGRVYIGSAKNLKTRAYHHQSMLRAGKHPCKVLQKDFNNGDKLQFSTIKKVHTVFSKELFRQEAEEIYNRRGERLYNVKWTSGKYNYLPFSAFVERFADSFCRDQIGIPLWDFKRRNAAEQEFLFMRIYYPEDAEKKKAEYLDGIEYLRKLYLYRERYGVDYDEYAELPPDEKRKIKYYKIAENQAIMKQSKTRRP